MIVPSLRNPVYIARYQLVRAFLGEINVTIPIDRKTGVTAGPTEWKFFQEGSFLKLYNLTPRFTRVGAVVCIEDYMSLDGSRLEHSAVVLFNPFAECAVDRSEFSSYPQIPLEDNTLRWSDGRVLYP